MTDLFLGYLSIAGALGLGLVAGVLLGFSDFIMRSLRDTADRAAGIDAMQAINRRILPSVFILLFLGFVPALIGLALLAQSSASPAAGWIFAAAVIYVSSVFGVTLVRNVPMNNRLAAVDAGSLEAERYWALYLSHWTRWNHVRTAGSGASAACLMMAAAILL